MAWAGARRRAHGGTGGGVAIGAFSRATVGFSDRDTQSYMEIPVEEQVEVRTLMGDIAVAGDRLKVHAHTVLGCRDGTTRGGHLLEGRVWPTLEVVVTEVPGHLSAPNGPCNRSPAHRPRGLRVTRHLLARLAVV